MEKKKVIITGGHLTPALALIAELKRRKSYDLFYIGRIHAMEGDKSESLEYNSINKTGIQFIELSAGRLQRAFTIHTIPSLMRVPFSIMDSFKILNTINPDVVMSFGGYVALPVCLAAYLKKIPVITHEQTSVLGLSNRIISYFAKYITLSWPETKFIGKRTNTIITGNPIRSNLLNGSDPGLWNFGNKKLPLIYVTGGSQGSRSINLYILENLPQLVQKFRLIHQCGNAEQAADFDKLTLFKEKLNNFSDNYKVVKTINPDYTGNLMKNADLVIGRSGANTVTELIYLNKKAIFIPLPWSGDNEQEENARMSESLGIGRIIHQDEMYETDLINIIQTELKRDNGKVKLICDSAGKIADILSTVHK